MKAALSKGRASHSMRYRYPVRARRELVEDVSLWSVLTLTGAVLSLLFGSLFLAAPRQLRRLSEALSRTVVMMEEALMQYHLITGTVLLLVGLVLLYRRFVAGARLTP